MAFDPITLRSNFDEWELSWLLNKSFDSNSPMGNIARNTVATILLGWLVGLHDAMSCVLPRTLEWLDIAISQGEDYGTAENMHRADLYEAKALNIWMLNSSEEVNLWKNVLHTYTLAMETENIWPKRDVNTAGLDDFMAYAFLANEYDVAIAKYEQINGGKTFSLNKKLKPRDFCYACCLQRVHQKFDPESLLEAGNKMLDSHLDKTWLSYGQYIRPAIWLRIVHAHEPIALTPLQTMLKAYDHIADVKRPFFV